MTQLAVPLWQKYVPLNRRGQRDWKAITDEHLLAYGMCAIEAKGISRRHKLEKSDLCLFQALHKRGLIGKILPEKRKTRAWASMTDTQLTYDAQKFVTENGIRNRHGLENAYPGLYAVLKKRQLIGIIFPEKRQTRDWASLSDAQLVFHAQKIMEDAGINGRKKLETADAGLYYVLIRRGLIDQTFLQSEKRNQDQLTKLLSEAVDAYTEK
jgi:hypothetical protein